MQEVHSVASISDVQNKVALGLRVPNLKINGVNFNASKQCPLPLLNKINSSLLFLDFLTYELQVYQSNCFCLDALNCIVGCHILPAESVIKNLGDQVAYHKSLVNILHEKRPVKWVIKDYILSLD